MSDNDLIRRGDVLDALEHRVGTVSQWNLVTKAINAIPAVTGEPYAYEAEYENKTVALVYEENELDPDNVEVWGNVKLTPLYTTPQNQSALIAELKAQLANALVTTDNYGYDN